MGKLVNKRELASILGKSEQALTTWQQEGMPMMKKEGNGKSNWYDTEAVVDWLLSRQKERNLTELEIERTRLTKAQADKLEIEIDALRRNLLPMDLIRLMWQGIVAGARIKIMGIAARIRTKNPTVSTVVLAEVEEACRDALEDLSGDGIPAEFQKRIDDYCEELETSERFEPH